MAEKGTHKGRGRAKIDEENDVFLSFINKRKRNNKKKLTEIEDLEKRDPSTLKPEQLTKIKGKGEIAKQNAYWHEIKDLYYQALKTNQEEGGKKTTIQKEGAKEQEKAPVKEETQKVHKEEKPKADAIRPIVSLIHVNEFFGNAATREEFDKGYMNMSGSLGLSTFPDLKGLHDFAHKVFRTCGTTNTSSGDCLDKAVQQLQKYVDGSDEKAAGDKSYAYFHDVVSKLAASEFFRSHKAQHAEHKHAGEHEHKHEPKKHESPKKTHHEEPKKTHHEEPKKVHHEEPKKVHHEEPKKVHHEEPKKVHHEEPKKVHHEEPKKVHHEEPKKVHHEEPKKTHHEEPKKHDSPAKTSKTHHKEETRAPQENTEEWDKYDDDEEEEVKQAPTKKKTENAEDDFVEVTAKYLDKKKAAASTGTGRGNRRGNRGGYRGGESRGGDREHKGEYRGGESRGGDREHKGEYKGGERPFRERREGDGQPRPRRGEGYQGRRRGGQGKEEYVPKQQGTTQSPTQTQTQQ